MFLRLSLNHKNSRPPGGWDLQSPMDKTTPPYPGLPEDVDAMAELRRNRDVELGAFTVKFAGLGELMAKLGDLMEGLEDRHDHEELVKKIHLVMQQAHKDLSGATNNLSRAFMAHQSMEALASQIAETARSHGIVVVEA